MKPFSIKEHLEHPEWKVVTREGKPVQILRTDLDDNDYPVAAVVGNFHVDKYTAEGLFQAGKKTDYDLFFAPEKHEGWVIISKLPVVVAMATIMSSCWLRLPFRRWRILSIWLSHLPSSIAILR